MTTKASHIITKQFISTGDQVVFMGTFFRNIFRTGFEWNELIRQCYIIGYKSFSLVAVTGFVLGFVLTLQSEPTLKDFGAITYVPSMVAISVIREIGPVMIALICAGKIASSIGAELGSMKVSEQIDAMDVSGANPIQYLVVTRILACIIMIPLLTLMADALALIGGFVASNISNDMNLVRYFNKAFSALSFSDLIPAVIKTLFFGFAIGFVGCFKGYNSDKGTESVGVAANSDNVVINISHLKKSFGDKEVLRDVNMQLRKGENLVVLGKSGSGKSVTIKCIVGLLIQDSGKLEIFGKEVSRMNEDALRQLRLKVGFLFQSGALYDSMTVEQNLEFPLTRVLKLHDKDDIRHRIEEMLSGVGLLDAMDKMPSDLSGGMRKRIGLARTLILKPDIMLYDEPTTGLDPITSREISELILQMQQKYKTSSIIITHDMACAEITADRLLVLHEGAYIAEGTYNELKNGQDELVRSFFK
jgi:ABC transport permease subunit